MLIALFTLWLFGIILTLHAFALFSQLLDRKARGKPIVTNYLDFSTRFTVPKVTFWRDRFNMRIYNHPKKLSKMQRVWQLVTGFKVMVEVTPRTAVLQDADDFGLLWEFGFSNNTTVRIIHVVNSTPEPDGSYSEYDIRVPNTVSSAHQAVAWTFGLGRMWTAYKPRVQT